MTARPDPAAVRRRSGRCASLRGVTAAGPRAGGPLAEAAYQDIRRRVLRCELAPGERVSEAGLVVLTGHSRTPVREALGRLAREGLVRPIPRQGYQVTPVTLGDVEDLFDMWSILGPAAAERAAGRLTAAQRERMRAALEVGGYRAEDAASVDAFLAASHDAQVTMAEATGNVRLVEAVERLDADFQRVFRLAFLAHDLGPRVSAVFADLLDALTAGDAARARDTAARAIAWAREDTVATLRNSPSVLGAPITGL